MQQLKMMKVGRVCENAPKFMGAQTIYDKCRYMTKLDREHFVVFHLNVKNQIIAKETVAIGTLNQVLVHPREVFKAAVHNGSAALVCTHNHPTGDPTPSKEDRAVTEQLREAGKLIGINVLDHIIIGANGKFFSFVEGENQLAAEKRRKEEFEQQDYLFRCAERAIAKGRATWAQVVLVADRRLLEAIVRGSESERLSEAIEIKQILEPIATRKHGPTGPRIEAQTLIGIANRLIEKGTNESQPANEMKMAA